MNPNTYYNQKVRGQKRKLEAIITLGGKCAICGYCKNISAMEFHHLDKNEKDFQLDTRKFANTSPEKLKLELAKCSILCSNCHKEIHHPELTFSYVKDLTEISSKKGLNELCGTECVLCGKRFPKASGKKYCSENCRYIDKKYPSLDELNEKHRQLNSWEKVAQFFGITRKITQTIRKRKI